MSSSAFLSMLTAIVAVGFISNAIATYIAIQNRERLRRSGRNGARRVVATGNIIQEWIRTIIQSLFLYAAVVALFVDPDLWIRQTTALAIAIASVLLVAKSLIAHYIRRRAIRELEHTIPVEMPVELVDRTHEFPAPLQDAVEHAVERATIDVETPEPEKG